MRKKLQPKVRAVRKQLKQQIPTASPQEGRQLAVLDEYASGMLTAFNTANAPWVCEGRLQTAEDLDEVELSLQRLSKKGGLGVRAVRTS